MAERNVLMNTGFDGEENLIRATEDDRYLDADEPLQESLLRHWRLMLLVFLCACFIFLWRLRPGVSQYIATVTVLLPQTNITGDNGAMSAASDFLPDGIPLKGVSTHIALLTGPGAIQRAADKLSLALRASGWGQSASLTSMVTARSPDAQSVVEIAVRANDATAATEMAHALITVYAERLAELRSAERQKSQRLTQERLRELQKLLGGGDKRGWNGKPNGVNVSTVASARKKQALHELEMTLSVQAEALNTVKPTVADFAPVPLDATTVLDPTARTWERALLASVVCALLLALLSAVWIEQFRRR